MAKFWSYIAKISPYPNFPGIEYDFLKEDHKNNFHTKNLEDSYSGVWKLNFRGGRICPKNEHVGIF